VQGRDVVVHEDHVGPLGVESCGTRPFLRCQDEILLTMRNPDRISHISSVVVPRDRSRVSSHAPS